MLDMEKLQDFHFLRPDWLYALIPLVLLFLTVRYFVKQQSGWQGVLANHLSKHVLTEEYGKHHRPPLSLLLIGWLLTVLALAGPTWEKLPQPVYQLHEGKVVVLDLSMSMRATDLVPDRLTRAKFKAIDLIKRIGEGETGLVAYAGDAFTISPLSTDIQNLTTLVPSLVPEIMPVQGSEPTLALQEASDLLANAGYPKGEIFFISDGVDNEQLRSVRKFIDGSPYRISVLGIGTEEGAPVKLVNGELLKDRSGSIVVPKLNQRNLATIANASGGRYIQLKSTDQDINYLVEQTDLSKQTDQEDSSEDNFGDEWEELGPYLVLLILPFAAYAFRKGVVLVLILGLLPLSSPKAAPAWWQDLWQTADQQGQKHFDAQDYQQAADAFEDPKRAGDAYFRQGEFQKAFDEYVQLDDVEALYNSGNALAQLGRIDEAIAAYDEVLNRQPEHTDAETNKALLEQLKEEQEQEDQQKQSPENKSNEQEGENQEQQNQGDQQQNNAEQNEQDQSQGDSQANSQGEEEQPPQDEEGKPEQQDQPEEKEQQEGAQNGEQGEQQSPAIAELTDEEKEQMQRLETLLRKVPDDPAYLLKRKMQLEYQNRRRSGPPSSRTKSW